MLLQQGDPPGSAAHRLLRKVIRRFDKLGHQVLLWKRKNDVKDYNDFARWLQTYEARLPRGDHERNQ